MDVIEGRYPPRDRIWLGTNSVQLVTSHLPTTVDALQERVAELAAQQPSLRWFSRPGPAPDRFRRAGDAAAAASFADGLVRALPSGEGSGTALERAAAAVLEEDDGTPKAALYAGHGVVGHRFPHIFGDGLTAASHLRRLAAGHETDSPAPFPVPGLEEPLAHALRIRYLAEGWLRAPGRLRADLALPRHAPAAGGAAVAPAAASAAAGRPRVQIVIRTLGAAAMKEIKAWRAAQGGGISTVAVQMAAVRRGLAERGLIAAGDGMFVAFDLRTYLKGANTGGNFISVPYLRPGDPADPASDNSAMKEATASGLPLVVLARGAARAALHRRAVVPQSRRPSSGRTVSFSHMRVGGILDPALLTRPEDGERLVVAAAMPPDEGGLTFMISEFGAQATLTAVFCSPFTEREPVEQVLDALVADPIGLLATG